eukprot:jgi/Botrbrau1/20345/Bobra.0006s0015.1
MLTFNFQRCWISTLVVQTSSRRQNRVMPMLIRTWQGTVHSTFIAREFFCDSCLVQKHNRQDMRMGCQAGGLDMSRPSCGICTWQLSPCRRDGECGSAGGKSVTGAAAGHVHAEPLNPLAVPCPQSSSPEAGEALNDRL